MGTAALPPLRRQLKMRESLSTGRTQRPQFAPGENRKRKETKPLHRSQVGSDIIGPDRDPVGWRPMGSLERVDRPARLVRAVSQ